jgi:hypothetical protein
MLKKRSVPSRDVVTAVEEALILMVMIPLQVHPEPIEDVASILRLLSLFDSVRQVV